MYKHELLMSPAEGHVCGYYPSLLTSLNSRPILAQEAGLVGIWAGKEALARDWAAEQLERLEGGEGAQAGRAGLTGMTA
ncbi:hypothetical protein MHYP_G00041600 [Metynnis hypsauchen]